MNDDELLTRFKVAFDRTRNIHASQLSMAERVERALLTLAYIIEIHGDEYLPLYEKFEAELAELQRKAEGRKRVRKRIEAFVPTP